MSYMQVSIKKPHETLVFEQVTDVQISRLSIYICQNGYVDADNPTKETTLERRYAGHNTFSFL